MFARWGLSNRLIVIVLGINVIILMAVIYLANSSSDAALQNQAIERFRVKSEESFQYIDERLASFRLAAQNMSNWAASYEDLLLTNDFHSDISQLLVDDDDLLIHRVSILRPDNTVITINTPNPSEADHYSRRIITIDNQLNNANFFDAKESDSNGHWFRQVNTVFDAQAVPSLTYAIPFTHAEGEGLIWFDIPMTVVEDLVIDGLNREGLLFESISGYALIVNANGVPVLAENLDISQLDVNRTTRTLLDRYEATNRSSDGLFHLADPFNSEQAGLFSIQRFGANNWYYITVLPENEIPAVPNTVFFPIFLVSIAGIAVLIYFVNRFIDESIVRPLVDLGRSASEIGEGNLRFIVFHLDKHDEVGKLANAMDTMRTRLRESYNALESWSRTLEERVESRTRELGEARLEAEGVANQLRAVYEESIIVVNNSQLSPVLEAFIDRILLLMEARYCAIWLLDTDKEHFRLVATNDSRRRRGDAVVTLRATEGIVGQAVRLDAPVIVNDYENYEHRVNLDDYYDDHYLPFNRGVCAPLKFAGFAIGAVVVGRPADAPDFNAQAERQLTLFTNMVAPSVRNAQLFVQLQEAVQEAKRANEVKTRFLASVTHELRTPLNLIINNMDFMRVGAFGDVNEEQTSRLNQTVRSAEHLLYLINDLLDVSKIEAGEMQLFIQEHEVYTMLEDAVDNAYALLDNDETKVGKVELRVEIEDDLAEIPMDARRIRQVLNNLLSNAIKFTEKGMVTLKVFKEDDGVHFSVHDTGMGIPHDEMDKLFVAFERTTGAKQKAIEGTGLGLPISRFLIQQHGSDLTVISEEGLGSTFAFKLPFETPENLGLSLTDTQQITAILSSKNE